VTGKASTPEISADEKPGYSSSRLCSWEILAWLAIAMVMRIWILDAKLLDRDESDSITRIAGLNQIYPYMPPYYSALALWGKTFGYSLGSLRFPSVVFSILSAMMMTIIMAPRVSAVVVRCALIMYAVSPLEIAYTQFIRPYSLVTFLLFFGLWLLLRSNRILTVAAACSVLFFAFLNHYYLVVGLFSIMSSWFLFSRIPLLKKCLWAGGLIVTAILALLFAGSILFPTHDEKLQAILYGPAQFLRLLATDVGIPRAFHVFSQFLWGIFLTPEQTKAGKILAILLMAWLCGAAWFNSSSRRQLMKGLVAVAIGVGIILYMQNGIGLTSAVPKYMHSLTFVMAYLIAAGYESWRVVSRRAAAIGLSLALAGQSAGAFMTLTTLPRHNMLPWGEVFVEIEKRLEPGELIITGSAEWHGMFHPRLANNSSVEILAYPNRIWWPGQDPVSESGCAEWMRQLEAKNGLWILRDGLDLFDPENRLLRRLNEEWRERDSFVVPCLAPGRPAHVSHMVRRDSTSSPSRGGTPHGLQIH
jgi:hypothetical protein